MLIIYDLDCYRRIYEKVKMQQCEKKQKHNNARVKVVIQQYETAKNTTYIMQIDDMFYVSYISLSSDRIFSLCLENPKKLKHEETTKSTMSSIRFLHFWVLEAKNRNTTWR
jgi:hypothetical protein